MQFEVIVTREGRKHAQTSAGSLWITLSSWHESQCQRLTTKDARSQLSVQKAMQGDKGNWEAGIGGVGCRAVDGWTRIGSKQVSKTTYSDKNCWPTHRHWQWGSEEGSALVPKWVPSTDQVDRDVLNGAREQRTNREMYLFFPHIKMSALVRVSRHFLQATAFVTID